MFSLSDGDYVAWELGKKRVSDPLSFKKKAAVIAKIRELGARPVTFVNEKTKIVVSRPCSSKEWQHSLKLREAVARGIPVVHYRFLEQMGDITPHLLTPPKEVLRSVKAAKKEENRWWENLGGDDHVVGDAVWGHPFDATWNEWTPAMESKPSFQVVNRLVFMGPCTLCIEHHLLKDFVYRVFIAMEGKTARYALASDAHKADQLLCYVSSMASRGGYVRSFLDCTLGSINGRKLFTDTTTASGSALSEKLLGLVESLYTNAWQKISQSPVKAHVDSVSAHPVNNITLKALREAEVHLCGVAGGLAKADMKVALEYAAKYTKALPVTCSQESVVKNLDEHQDIVDVLKDMFAVSEIARGNIYNASPEAQYNALGCEIRPAKDGVDHIRKMVGTNRVLRVWEVHKQLEGDQYESEMSNWEYLLHGSPAGNWVSVLSKGLRIPMYRRRRRDHGMLGRGIYFTDSGETAMKYVTPGANGVGYILVCKVALGSVYVTTVEHPSLEKAPEGFDSVHARPGGDFTDNEYVVYRETQKQMAYLVEVSVPGAPPPPVPLPLKHWQPDQPRTLLRGIPGEQDFTPFEPKVGETKVGLVADGREVPLQGVSIKAKLLDMIGEVYVFQQYFNASTTPIEAKYVFPLQYGATVCGFEAYINDKHLVGITKEKEQAHREYKKAVEEGKGAYLLDESESPEVFTVSVGNLPPKSTVVVKITYVTELEVVNDSGEDTIRFIVPSNVHPAVRDAAVGPGSSAVVSRGMPALELEVAVAMPWDIKDLTASHPISVKRSARHGMVRLEEGDTARDFVLDVHLGNMATPRMWVEDDGTGTRAAMLSMYPEKNDMSTVQDADPNTAHEVILLVDCSASMIEGSAFSSAVQAAELMLAGLQDHPSLRFNIAAFGNTFLTLFPAAVPVTLKHRVREAVGFLRSLQPDLGGTNLELPLSCLLAPMRHDRTVFLITDGLFEDSLPSLTNIARRGSATTRLFALGTGANCISHTVKVLADAGGGAGEVLNESSKSQWVATVKRQIRRCRQCVLSNVEVDWSGERSEYLRKAANEQTEQAPRMISGLFFGERRIVYGFSERIPRRVEMVAKQVGPGVELVGYDEIPEQRFLVTPWPSHFISGDIIHKLCAKATITDWEQGVYSVNPLYHQLALETMKARVLELGLKYNIVTKFTSMLAIEERTEEEKKGLVKSSTPSLTQLASRETIDVLPELGYKTSLEAKQELEEEAALLSRLALKPPETTLKQPVRAEAVKKEKKDKKKKTKKEKRKEEKDGKKAEAVDPLAAEVPSISMLFLSQESSAVSRSVSGDGGSTASESESEYSVSIGRGSSMYSDDFSSSSSCSLREHRQRGKKKRAKEGARAPSWTMAHRELVSQMEEPKLFQEIVEIRAEKEYMACERQEVAMEICTMQREYSACAVQVKELQHDLCNAMTLDAQLSDLEAWDEDAAVEIECLQDDEDEEKGDMAFDFIGDEENEAMSRAMSYEEGLAAAPCPTSVLEEEECSDEDMGLALFDDSPRKAVPKPPSPAHFKKESKRASLVSLSKSAARGRGGRLGGDARTPSSPQASASMAMPCVPLPSDDVPPPPCAPAAPPPPPPPPGAPRRSMPSMPPPAAKSSMPSAAAMRSRQAPEARVAPQTSGFSFGSAKRSDIQTRPTSMGGGFGAAAQPTNAFAAASQPMDSAFEAGGGGFFNFCGAGPPRPAPAGAGFGGFGGFGSAASPPAPQFAMMQAQQQQQQQQQQLHRQLDVHQQTQREQQEVMWREAEERRRDFDDERCLRVVEEHARVRESAKTTTQALMQARNLSKMAKKKKKAPCPTSAEKEVERESYADSVSGRTSELLLLDVLPLDLRIGVSGAVLEPNVMQQMNSLAQKSASEPSLWESALKLLGQEQIEDGLKRGAVFRSFKPMTLAYARQVVADTIAVTMLQISGPLYFDEFWGFDYRSEIAGYLTTEGDVVTSIPAPPAHRLVGIVVCVDDTMTQTDRAAIYASIPTRFRMVVSRSRCLQLAAPGSTVADFIDGKVVYNGVPSEVHPSEATGNVATGLSADFAIPHDPQLGVKGAVLLGEEVFPCDPTGLDGRPTLYEAPPSSSNWESFIVQVLRKAQTSSAALDEALRDPVFPSSAFPPLSEASLSPTPSNNTSDETIEALSLEDIYSGCTATNPAMLVADTSDASCNPSLKNMSYHPRDPCGATRGRSTPLDVPVLPALPSRSVPSTATIPLIRRNTTIPVKKTLTFTNPDSQDGEVVIEVFEGTHTDPKKLTKLAECSFNVDHTGPYEARLEITIDCDPNGVLTLSVCDRRKYLPDAVTVVIPNENRMTCAEIEKMVRTTEAEASSIAEDGKTYTTKYLLLLAAEKAAARAVEEHNLKLSDLSSAMKAPHMKSATGLVEELAQLCGVTWRNESTPQQPPTPLLM